MRLAEGILIVINNDEGGELPQLDDNSTSRIELSSGVEKTDGRIPLFAKESFVPTLPWRNATASETELLFGIPTRTSPQRMGSTVWIIQTPPELLNPITSTIDSPSLGQQEKEQLLKTPIRDLREFASSFVVGQLGILKDCGIKIDPPNLRTTTVNPDDEFKFVGLHLDSFFDGDFTQRRCSPNRICFNLGREDRFFIFLNLELISILNHLERCGYKETWHKYGPNSVNLFMETFSDYPIVKLRVRPGEAYIAPTENLIHDATTETKICPDVTATFLGQFRP